MITVMLACNDRNMIEDTLRLVSVGDDCETLYLEGDIEDGDKFDTGKRVSDGRDCLIVNDHVFYYQGRKKYVGNVHWDSVQMEPDEAARLVNYLRSLPHWCCTCAETGLYNKWNNKETITAADLERAVQA